MNDVPPATPGRRLPRFGLVEVAIVLTLALLLIHAAVYAGLTDDAFISFRYARNLAQGHGLVFNPGFEPVEGYTNFLWVLALASFDALGFAPESVAHVLTISATIVLWGLVVWFSYRTPPRVGRRWLLLAPALLLAATRSVAVWSTSGLETRWFEVLIIGGAFRLIVEVEARLAGRPRRSVFPVLFALATLTRPDGLLISVCAFATAGWRLAGRGRLNRRAFALEVGLYALIVGAHYVFRLIYYGQWLPNTYYAKVDGRTWWDMGFVYFGVFALEYAAYLWVPLLVVAVYEHRSRKTLFTPILFAAVVGPHALYIASIGGDHFEYRPLDLYFPFVFILLYDGARRLARGTAWCVITAGYLCVVLLGLTALPYQSHKQFIDYMPSGGFPGLLPGSADSAEFMRPARDPIYHLPGLRYIAQAHLNLLRTATASFVGIRQEEQWLFLDTVLPEGRRLKRLVESGRLPADAHIAIDCMGAIPYYSDLRVLDVLGLTDAHVAHSDFSGKPRMMAHDKRATADYIRRAGVDLWALDNVHALVHVADRNMLAYILMAPRQPRPVYAASIGDGYYLLGFLPQGIEHASRRFPALRFRPLAERSVATAIVRQGIGIFREQLREEPGDHDTRAGLADRLTFTEDAEDAGAAIPLYTEILVDRPGDCRIWFNLARAYFLAGELNQAIDATERGLETAEGARDRTNRQTVKALRHQLARYRALLRQPRGRQTATDRTFAPENDKP